MSFTDNLPRLEKSQISRAKKDKKIFFGALVAADLALLSIAYGLGDKEGLYTLALAQGAVGLIILISRWR